VRRSPRQPRGEARVTRLLDAAAAVIAEVGVDATTTNAIAAAAATSVGSLYQFVSNQDAIVHALAQRLADGFDTVKDEVLHVRYAHDPLERLIGRVVTGIGQWCDAHSAYLRVNAHASAHNTPAAARERAVLHEPVVAMVDRMLAEPFPHVARAQRDAVARVQVQTVHAVVMYSAALAPAHRARVRKELVRTLASALVPFDRG
jgi:AcrR family transcriptional regulator